MAKNRLLITGMSVLTAGRTHPWTYMYYSGRRVNTRSTSLSPYLPAGIIFMDGGQIATHVTIIVKNSCYKLLHAQDPLHRERDNLQRRKKKGLKWIVTWNSVNRKK